MLHTCAGSSSEALQAVMNIVLSKKTVKVIRKTDDSSTDTVDKRGENMSSISGI
jgi:hypothetical protein